MKKYSVRIYIPSYYELEAKNAQEASKMAEEKFKQEHGGWITPVSELIELTSEVLLIEKSQQF